MSRGILSGGFCPGGFVRGDFVLIPKQIPQAELRLPKDRGDNGKILPFVATFNPNNPSVYAIIKSTFESLQENEVDGMRDCKLIHSRR